HEHAELHGRADHDAPTLARYSSNCVTSDVVGVLGMPSVPVGDDGPAGRPTLAVIGAQAPVKIAQLSAADRLFTAAINVPSPAGIRTTCVSVWRYARSPNTSGISSVRRS